MFPPSPASRRARVIYQRARCSDSVRASHTTRIGCRMLRSNVIVAYSPSNVTVPPRLIFRDPLVELREALGLDRVDPLLRADGDIDELGVTEYPQVLRDPRLGEARKPRDDGPGGPASARK